MTETTFVLTQRATKPLQHGRIVWEIDNSKVIRFAEMPHDPATTPVPLPEIEFVGEGIATYEMQLIYQPTPESFPCLISNPRFRLRVFWNDEIECYLAAPVDVREMNRSSQWLYEGVQTMNALHAYAQGHKVESDERMSDSDQVSGLLQNRIGEFIGTILGAAGRTYFG